MEKATIAFKNEKIQYHKIGHGKKKMLAFHGFGQDGTHFQSFGRVLSDEYTTYSFDLFYHGKSYWSMGDEALTKEFWIDFISHFSAQQQVDKFSLCGFSLGAKFALATLEGFPERVEKILLIAPDGIRTNFWYSLATRSALLQVYFKSMIDKPHRFFRLVKMLRKVGLINRSISQFASTQMFSERKRRQVYFSWVVFKKLSFDLKKVTKIICEHDIDVHIFLGKSDKIITRKGMDRLIKNLKTFQIHLLEGGHYKLIDKTAATLKDVDL